MHRKGSNPSDHSLVKPKPLSPREWTYTHSGGKQIDTLTFMHVCISFVHERVSQFIFAARENYFQHNRLSINITKRMLVHLWCKFKPRREPFVIGWRRPCWRWSILFRASSFSRLPVNRTGTSSVASNERADELGFDISRDKAPLGRRQLTIQRHIVHLTSAETV